MSQAAAAPFRVGSAVDIHAFEAGIPRDLEPYRGGHGGGRGQAEGRGQRTRAEPARQASGSIISLFKRSPAERPVLRPEANLQ